jgi:DNA-binding NtrC family response regulator
MSLDVLIVDDDPHVRGLLTEYLTQVGYVPYGVASLGEARQAVAHRRFRAVLLDLQLPDGNGLDWIPDLREEDPDVAIIVVTGHGDIPQAVEAMRRGADHFLTKPLQLQDLATLLRKSIDVRNLHRQEAARRRLGRREEPFFGHSPAMRRVREMAAIAAESDAPVLLMGETGTGKGVLARWIHEHSPRQTGPFVEINCSTLRGELLASELFGHARGAFTSAVEAKEGLIEVADGGTLFLDEIGDMDPSLQAAFLKVLEEKVFRRLGEVRPRRSDFRLICATHQDLEAMVETGRFRQDLFYRIHVFPIVLPPLRERVEDIPGLVEHLLQTLGAPHPRVAPEVLRLLMAYPWPGNIRELRNVLERALLLARGEPLRPEHFPGLTAPRRLSRPTAPVERLDTARVLEVLTQVGGNKKEAARRLGISRATLYRHLRRMKVS